MKAKLIKAAMAIIMLLVILGLIYNNHQIKKELKQAQELAAADSTQYFKTKVNSLGQTVSTQDQTIPTMDNAIALGLIRESELKANNLKLVSSNVRLTEQLTAAGLAGQYDKPPVIIYVPSEGGKTPCLRLPTAFGYHDTWLSIRTSIDTLGNAIYDSISVISKPSVWVGIEKTGLFKKDKPVVAYTNENPYFTTTAMTNVVISDKKKWYKTRGFALGVGALGGIIGTTLLLK
ncbi:MAG: hypothetical protein WC238_04590 [Parcubacteria group bacterium]|jgi:hypothetical protein